MDGENNGKPYFLMDDLEVPWFLDVFGNTNSILQLNQNRTMDILVVGIQSIKRQNFQSSSILQLKSNNQWSHDSRTFNSSTKGEERFMTWLRPKKVGKGHEEMEGILRKTITLED